jgi:hypothetical protein
MFILPPSGVRCLYLNVTVRGGAGGGTFSTCSRSLALSPDGRLDTLSGSRRIGSRGELVLLLLLG